MPVEIIRSDARCLPLADSSVDLVVSSPPYWSLRAYQDNGETYDGQIGSEATSQEFIDNLLEVMRECMRVLKPTGSIFWNLGDKYGPNKSLALLPERFRIAACDQLGLICRAVIIWSKPNGLPESVTDRVRRSHEDWMHFTLQSRYFSAVDEIREAHQHPTITHTGPRVGRGEVDGNAQHLRMGLSPLGKLPGSVWTVPTEPLRVPESLGVDHFAAFPTSWPRRIVQGWSPSGVCTGCGEGRRPVVVKERTNGPVTVIGAAFQPGSRTETADGRRHQFQTDASTTGYACACPDTAAPTTPAVVLDPFGGTGTTALVAHALGRHGISNDMSADYCRLARWRTSDPAQLAKAMGVTKPPVEIDGQADLFGEDVA